MAITVPARKPRKNKYGATRYRFFGHEFDSKKEAHHYLDLRDRRKHGLITGLELQPKIAIVIGGQPVRYPSGKQMIYTADFKYFDVAAEEWVIEDVKSVATRKERGYRMVRALLFTMGVEVREV